MKLIVKRIEAGAVPGGYALMLCTEDGEILPMQTCCSVVTGIHEARLTVEFAIDGEEIRIAE